MHHHDHSPKQADDELTSHGLSKAQVEIRKFNARRTFRASVRSVSACHALLCVGLLINSGSTCDPIHDDQAFAD